MKTKEIRRGRKGNDNNLGYLAFLEYDLLFLSIVFRRQNANKEKISGLTT